MVRQLKHHEERLLRKVDFLQWKTDSSLKESQVMRRYHIQRREDYIKYNKICGQITKLANKIALLNPKDPFRFKMSESLLDKLHKLGFLSTKNSLSQCSKISVASICRRRLPIILVRMKMAENVKEAVELVEQAHVRVGTETITDPAYLVTRTMEDFVTWVDSSKIKRKISKYNDLLDDYDLLS